MLKDKNSKYNLYEEFGILYYIMVDRMKNQFKHIDSMKMENMKFYQI